MNDYLQHYGILGMKWGVRRYQNEDGSLTAAGKKRYSSSEVKEARKNLSSEREKLSSMERRKSRIEGETEYANSVYKVRREAIDSWDEKNNRPLSKQESDVLWKKYEKTYARALKNNKEYQQLLKDYDLQKTKVSDLTTAANQKIGSDYVGQALGSLGTAAALALVTYALQRSRDTRYNSQMDAKLSQGPIIVDRNGNPVDIEF